MSWQRARSPEQKAERRDAIVAAGARLLRDAPMSEVSLNAIAREAGLAKSNLYRYFSTREEIFLALLADDVEGWVLRSEGQVRALPDDPSPSELAEALVAGMTEHSRMIRLLGQLVSVLERNASVERIVEFKLRMGAIVARQAAALAEKVPWMDLGAATQLLFVQVTLLQGLWPYHDPPPAMVEAMEHPALTGLHPTLEEALHRATVLLIEGLAAEAARR